MQLRRKKEMFIFLLLILSLLQVNETLSEFSTPGRWPVGGETYNIREEPSDPFQHYSSRSRGNGSTFLYGETDFQMINFATDVFFQEEIVNVSWYGDTSCSSCSFRLSMKIGYPIRMVGGDKAKEEQKIHSNNISDSNRAREEGVHRQKDQHHRREREIGHPERSVHKQRIERNFLRQYSLLRYFIVLGISFMGISFVCVLFLRDNGQPQSLPSQQIDVSFPTSSPACGYYSYGDIFSAVALVLFLIYFSIKKFRLL